jgi:hypothetical protein
MQSKYLTDKPATRKLVELLIRRNDKFSRRLLVEMMQLREEEITQNNIDDLVKEYKEVADMLSSLIRRLYDKGTKFQWFGKIQPNSKLTQELNSDKIITFIARDVESAGLIKRIKEYINIKNKLEKQIKDKKGNVDHEHKGIINLKTKETIAGLAITKFEVAPGSENAKSALGRILMFFGANFKLLWEKLTTKYKLAFWGSIILGLLLVILVTIYKYGKENTVAKVIKNVLIAAITGFALYNLIVLIISLKDQFSTEWTPIRPF